MITGIAIENFKGISDRIELEFKPITLLFGSNSAGKSSVLHALHYLREIFVNGNVDAVDSEIGGEFVDLGGLPHMIHGRDRNSQMRFRISATVDFKEHEHNSELKYQYYPDMLDYSSYQRLQLTPDLLGQLKRRCTDDSNESLPYWNGLWFREPIRTVDVDVVVKEGKIDLYSVWINNEFVGEIKLGKAGIPLLVRLNSNHPVIPTHFWKVEDVDEYDYELLSLPGEIEGLDDDWDPRIEQRALAELKRVSDRILKPNNANENGISWAQNALNEFESEDPGDGKEWGFFVNGCTNGGLPPLESPIYPGNVHADFLSFSEASNTLMLYADVLMGFPGRVIRNGLNDFLHLGPIRDLHRHESPLTRHELNDWSSGTAAWTVLEKSDDLLVDKVSDWLSSEKKLSSGFRIERKNFYVVAEEDLEAFVETLNDPGQTTGEALPKSSRKARTRILKQDGNLMMRPHDLGVGISQVLPVVVMALHDEKRLLLFEQPELHLHPRMQAELGDLFIESALGETSHSVVIETHSEHLILRLLRRIRETEKGNAPPEFQLRTDQIAIYYLDGREGATKACRIDVDVEGRFIQPWPDDFFEIDFRERFPDVR
ncbi:MAG: AAA family ATPase [Planctomycetaceae bacterium]|nr:AAA family ATPase [Planctomycetaceae bacterium]